jgi:hypothetical protein
MIRGAAILALLAFAPAALAADDLPPGVLLLSRIKRHVREQVERLPDYTCLQTNTRYRRDPGQRAPAYPTDVVVLEVLNAGSKELYASPGARDFSDEHPSSFAAGGLSGTGIFGLFLRTLFVQDNAMMQYRGEEDFAGHHAVRYDYRVPTILSGFNIQLSSGAGRVATKGSFRVDPETLNLLSLEVEADDIPPNLRVVSIVQRVEYASTRIGDRDTVLPESAEMHLVEMSGAESHNFLDFTHCRSFAAESKLTFEAPTETPSSASGPRAEKAPIPAGLTVTMELSAPITQKQAVGSLVQARVAADVKDKNKVVLRAGAAVRGRIRRLESQSGYYIVGLEFTDIETEGGPARFYANLQDVDKRAHVVLRRQTREARGVKVEETYLPELPGVASFFVEGADLTLPEGFQSVWKTTSPRSASR